MGFFDSQWIVYYEYSTGFFSSYKKASIVVEASSRYDAERKAKSVLRPLYKYLRIRKVEKKAK